jgi:hypothetical protein
MGRGASKNKISRLMSDVEMLHMEYLQPHLSKYIRTKIVIDIDSALDIQALKKSGIPMPATIVGRALVLSEASSDNPYGSNRPHLSWNLRIPVNFPRFDMQEGSKKTSYNRQKFVYQQIRGELIKRLTKMGVKVDTNDPCLTKNPLHHDWHVIECDTRTWTLSELKKELNFEYETVKSKNKNKELPATAKLWKDTSKVNYKVASDKYFDEDNALLGRETMLFQSIRGLAYLKKAYCSSQQQLLDFVINEAESFNKINNRANPISTSQIIAISKSIAKWTWENYRTSTSKDLGACYREGLISSTMTKRRKQQAGADYTASLKSSKTRKKVLDYIDQHSIDSKEPSISSIAKSLKMTRATVRKYMNDTPIPETKVAKSVETPGGGHLGTNKGGSIERRVTSPSSTLSDTVSGDTLYGQRDGIVYKFTRDDRYPGILIDQNGGMVKEDYVILHSALSPVPINEPQSIDIPF